MRVVFDTNVLVSALLFEQSIPAQALFAAMKAGEILISEMLVNEINDILHSTRCSFATLRNTARDASRAKNLSPTFLPSNARNS